MSNLSSGPLLHLASSLASLHRLLPRVNCPAVPLLGNKLPDESNCAHSRGTNRFIGRCGRQASISCRCLMTRSLPSLLRHIQYSIKCSSFNPLPCVFSLCFRSHPNDSYSLSMACFWRVCRRVSCISELTVSEFWTFFLSPLFGRSCSADATTRHEPQRPKTQATMRRPCGKTTT